MSMNLNWAARAENHWINRGIAGWAIAVFGVFIQEAKVERLFQPTVEPGRRAIMLRDAVGKLKRGDEFFAVVFFALHSWRYNTSAIEQFQAQPELCNSHAPFMKHIHEHFLYYAGAFGETDNTRAGGLKFYTLANL